MKTDNTFKKITGVEKRLYGPEKLLVCGYTTDERRQLLSFLDNLGFASIPVVFVSDNDAHVTLHELLKRNGNTGMEEKSEMKRAIIISGFTEKKLKDLLSAYKKEGLQKQFWAVVTPTSENWSIDFLLKELEKEEKAIKARQKNNS